MDILNDVLSLVVLGFTVEAIVETIKMVYTKDKLNVPVVLSLAVGVLVALAVDFDLFLFLGFTSVIPFVGVVLAGILMSRGGNFVHEWYRNIRGGNK